MFAQPNTDQKSSLTKVGKPTLALLSPVQKITIRVSEHFATHTSKLIQETSGCCCSGPSQDISNPLVWL